MLKIKDEIDLKELEKFGYYSEDIGLNDPFIIYKKYIKSYISIDIYPDKTIHKNNDENEGTLTDEEVQDLIQAGLVEKVDDEI